MGDQASNELEALAALLGKFGPINVLKALVHLCANTAHAAKADPNAVTPELWECAAQAIGDAVVALEGGGEDADADDNEGADATHDVPEEAVDDGGADEPNDNEADEDEGDTSEDDAPLSSTWPEHKAPSSEVSTETDGMPEGDDASGAEATTNEDAGGETPQKVRNMAKLDPEFGARPEAATHWRCRRITDERSRKGEPLSFEVGGYERYEWSIRAFPPSMDLLFERWGEGVYVIHWMHLDANGSRGCGSSRAVPVRRPGAKRDLETPTSAEPREPQTATVAPAPMPAAPSAAAFAMGHGGGFEGHPLASLMGLMSFMRENEDRAHARAQAESRAIQARVEAEARATQARVEAEARIAAERLRAETELQMERERLASKERIAQIEAMNRGGGRAPAFDAQAFGQQLATAIGTQVRELGERLQESIDEIGEAREGEEAKPATPPDTTAQFVALAEKFAPMLMMLMEKAKTQEAPAALQAAPQPTARPNAGAPVRLVNGAQVGHAAE